MENPNETDVSDIRLESGAMGRIWQNRENGFGWSHPNGSQGVAPTWSDAERDLNDADAPAYPFPFLPEFNRDANGRPNEERADAGLRALLEYNPDALLDPDSIVDLITDLLHQAHRDGLDPRQVWKSAAAHFRYESAESEPCAPFEDEPQN